MMRAERSMARVLWAVVLLAGCGPEAPGDGGVDGVDAGDAGCRAMCGASCVDTRTDVRHCGACDRDCTALEGVRAGAVACVEGACVIDGTCAPGRGDCDGEVETGCEASLTSAARCGACGTSCSGATPVCAMTGEGEWACSDECAAPAPDPCGDECVDTLRDVANCGACGHECSAPEGATPTCSAGECGFECGAGLHRCADACVANDAIETCGASCTPCPTPAHATPTCDGTSCGFECDAGHHRCGDTCVADDSLEGCGGSCSPCPTPAHATATCDGTSCGFECDAGHHRCGDTCVADDSAEGCGGSCTPCAAPANATATCDGTSCGFECNAGYHLCGDACVSNSSVDSCGDSCTRCPAPENGWPTCIGATCRWECLAGYHACGDTCEPNISPTACGAGCVVCPVPANGQARCSWGVCAIQCDFGYVASGDECVAPVTTVGLGQIDPEVMEGPTSTASFRVSRTGMTGAPLTVHLTIHESSTATVEPGGPLPVDVQFHAPATSSGRSLTVVLPAGVSSEIVRVSAYADSHAELAESLRIDLVADPAYEIAGGGTTTVMIAGGGGTNVITSGDSLTDYAVREGSLRLALENARALPSPVVNASITGPIMLVAPLPLLDFDVTINGPAPERLILDGGDATQMAEVRGWVRFDHLTLRRGFGASGLAGAIYNRGRLTVDQCRFENNRADSRGSAIYSFLGGATPVLIVESSAFENNTGAAAIWSDGADVSVRNSTFSGNTGGNIVGGYMNLGGNTPANP